MKRTLSFTILLAASAAQAVAQDTLAVIGARELAVDARVATRRVDTLFIPVRTVPAASPAVFSLHVVQLTLDGQSRDPAAVKLLGPTRVDDGLSTVLALVDLTKVAEPGSYAVRAQALRTDTPGQTPQLLDFTITRNAAELRVAGPIRIEHTKWFFSIATHTTPSRILIAEAGGRSAFFAADTVAHAELRRSDNHVLDATVSIHPAEGIDAWRQRDVALVLNGSPQVGTAGGTLVLRSPQLAARMLEVGIEVVTRVSRIWLFAAIITGILLGWLTRTRIDERKRRYDALRAVAAQNDRLADLVRPETTVDAELRRKLVQIKDTLVAATPPAGPSAEDLVQAADTARTGIEEALAEAEVERARLRHGLAELRAALGSPEGHASQVRHVVEREIERATLLDERLAAGEIAAVAAELAALRRDVGPAIRRTVHDWLGSIDSALERIGRWPDRGFDAAIDEATAAVAAIRALPPPSTIELLATVLPQAALLAGDVQQRIVVAGSASLQLLATDVRANLQKLGNTEVDAKAAHIAVAAQLLAGMAHGKEAAVPDDVAVEAFADGARNLRAALTDAIQFAYDRVRTAQDPAEPEGLGEGRIMHALEEVHTRWAKQTGERPLGRGALEKRRPLSSPRAMSSRPLPRRPRGRQGGICCCRSTARAHPSSVSG
jgi:hypothetical protein